MRLGAAGGCAKVVAMPSKPPSKELAELVRRHRKALGLTQLALARRVGLSAKHVNSIERASATASRATVLALANVLDAAPDVRDRLLVAAGYAVVAEPVPANTDAHSAVAAWTGHLCALPCFAFSNRGALLARNALAHLVLEAVFGPETPTEGGNFSAASLWSTLSRRIVHFPVFAGAIVERARREAAARRRAVISYDELSAILPGQEPSSGAPSWPWLPFQVDLDERCAFEVWFLSAGGPPLTAYDSPTVVLLVPTDDAAVRQLARLQERLAAADQVRANERMCAAVA